MDGENWVKVCPRCHSTDVTSRGAISDKALSPNWVCRSCGYQAGTFPEFKEEDLEELGAEDKGRKVTPAQNPFFSDTHGKPHLLGKPGKLEKILWVLLLIILMWLILR